jgi:hypothetical protein
MTGMRGAPTVAVVGGDAARWIVKVAGEEVATCGNASLARRTAEEIRRTLEREARIAAIRALADYLERCPEAPCDRVSASSWAGSADALADSAARMPESVLDNTRDVFVRVVVDFGSRGPARGAAEPRPARRAASRARAAAAARRARDGRQGRMRTAPFQPRRLARIAGCGPAGEQSALGSFGGREEDRSQHPTQRAPDCAGVREQADGDGDRRVCRQLAATAARRRTCRRGRGGVAVRISAPRYPATADHVLHALAAGHPSFCTWTGRARTPTVPGRSAASRLVGDTTTTSTHLPFHGRAAQMRMSATSTRGAGAVPGEQVERYCDDQRSRLRITG